MTGMLAEDGTRAPARLQASLPRGWRLGWRLAAGGIGTVLILVALGRMEWLQGAWLADAWRQQRRLVLGMALLQAVAGLLQGVRYHAMLRACGVEARLDESVGATCVSTGLSVWLPASAGVAELLRIGLLCRRGVPGCPGRLGQVMLASLMDRLLGFFMVFLLGGVCCALALWRGRVPPDAINLVRGAGAGALLVAGGLALAVRACMRGTATAPRDEWPWRRVAQARPGSLLHKLGIALAALRAQVIPPRDLLLPAALAILCFLVIGTIMGWSIAAIGGDVPFVWVMAMLPAVFLSNVLPVSVGGLGAPQLVGIIALGLLGAEPAVIASAGLLNAAVVLGIGTLLAVGFLPFVAPRTAFQRP